MSDNGDQGKQRDRHQSMDDELSEDSDDTVHVNEVDDRKPTDHPSQLVEEHETGEDISKQLESDVSTESVDQVEEQYEDHGADPGGAGLPHLPNTKITSHPEDSLSEQVQNIELDEHSVPYSHDEIDKPAGGWLFSTIRR